MPRTARVVEADSYYHVLNRGNARVDLFHKPADFDAFVRILADGLKRYPVDLLCWCLMNNHWHLVLKPRTEKALGQFIGMDVRDSRAPPSRSLSFQWRRASLSGGDSRSFPVQDDRHFLTPLPICGGPTPLRAGIVESAEDWRWSSLADRATRPKMLPTLEVGRSIARVDWTRAVDRPDARARFNTGPAERIA